MVPAHVPRILQWLLPGYVWRLPVREKVLYLTFDDGPIAEVTPWVLDELARAGAKATFFCIGRNSAAAPEIMARIRAEKHGVGNHTWDHPRGRRTSRWGYLRNVLSAGQVTSNTMFRPPYGSITLGQAASLRKRYRIVLWDVLSGDYNTALTGTRCAANVIGNASPGSIVVFHDSLKAEARLRIALPQVLKHFGALGYRFEALPFATAV
ncbi:MAG TPA: polysaccharide deacetylase family protein [Flavobacteriales bacterium]|nr:polysaccharide deacetylase family protein [Flavobacteriales bacterium]